MSTDDAEFASNGGAHPNPDPSRHGHRPPAHPNREQNSSPTRNAVWTLGKPPKRCHVKVALVAPNGSTQPVQLVIQVGEIVIESAEGRTLQKIPLLRIRKWIKASQRPKSPGPAFCLDLHIQFPDGNRELRLRCNAEKTVEDIMHALQEQHKWAAEHPASTTSISPTHAHPPSTPATQTTARSAQHAPADARTSAYEESPTPVAAAPSLPTASSRAPHESPQYHAPHAQQRAPPSRAPMDTPQSNGPYAQPDSSPNHSHNEQPHSPPTPHRPHHYEGTRGEAWTAPALTLGHQQQGHHSAERSGRVPTGATRRLQTAGEDFDGASKWENLMETKLAERAAESAMERAAKAESQVRLLEKGYADERDRAEDLGVRLRDARARLAEAEGENSRMRTELERNAQFSARMRDALRERDETVIQLQRRLEEELQRRKHAEVMLRKYGIGPLGSPASSAQYAAISPTPEQGYAVTPYHPQQGVPNSTLGLQHAQPSSVY